MRLTLHASAMAKDGEEFIQALACSKAGHANQDFSPVGPPPGAPDPSIPGALECAGGDELLVDEVTRVKPPPAPEEEAEVEPPKKKQKGGKGRGGKGRRGK